MDLAKGRGGKGIVEFILDSSVLLDTIASACGALVAFRLSPKINKATDFIHLGRQTTRRQYSKQVKQDTLIHFTESCYTFLFPHFRKRLAECFKAIHTHAQLAI